MTVLAVVNQKGGVGKTTVALGLAATAAARGTSVLVVDIDPQGNATSGAGVWGAERTVDELLDAGSGGADMASIVMDTGWGEWFEHPPKLLASSPRLAAVESQMASDPIGAQDRLAAALAGAPFDLVIIDCPPSMGLLTVSGLFAADAAIVVTEPSAWSMDGVELIAGNIERISQRRQNELLFAGIVVNRRARTRDARYWDDELVKAYPTDIVRPPIALRAVVTEASAQSQPITAATRSGAGTAKNEFAEVLDVLLGRVSHPSMPGGTTIDRNGS